MARGKSNSSEVALQAERVQEENAALILERDRLQAERDRMQEERDAAVAETLDAQQQLKELQEQLTKLQRHHFGRRSEKLNADQLLLFAKHGEEPSPEGSEAIEEVADDETANLPAKPRPGKKQRGLHFTKSPEQKIIEYPVEDPTCLKCGVEMEEIGEERSSQIEFEPAHFVELIHVRKKLACKQCEECVKRGPAPERVLAKALPGVVLSAWILVSKYQDHLPLNRLTRIFKRQGAEIPRSTLSDWAMKLADRLAPIVEAMKTEILASSYIQTDDTRVLTFVPFGKGNSKRKRVQAYLWPYKAQDQAVYDFTLSRARDGPETFLADFQGYLQTDDYVAYHRLQEQPGVVGVGCMAHARRRFHDVLEAKTDLVRVLPVIACIRLLYHVEAEARDNKMSYEERLALRRKRSRLILADLLRTLRKLDRDPGVPPKTLLGRAVSYMLRNWRNLRRYTEDGQLEIDNNGVEQCVRPVALGRKNWLFAGSPRGGKAAATIYSVIESCKKIDVDPFLYLQGVLALPDDHVKKNAASLTPPRWREQQGESDELLLQRSQLPEE